MAKVIRCQCGFQIRGETVDHVVRQIEAHMASDHPEIVGQVRRADLEAMAEDARST